MSRLQWSYLDQLKKRKIITEEDDDDLIHSDNDQDTNDEESEEKRQIKEITKDNLELDHSEENERDELKNEELFLSK